MIKVLQKATYQLFKNKQMTELEQQKRQIIEDKIINQNQWYKQHFKKFFNKDWEDEYQNFILALYLKSPEKIIKIKDVLQWYTLGYLTNRRSELRKPKYNRIEYCETVYDNIQDDETDLIPHQLYDLIVNEFEAYKKEIKDIKEYYLINIFELYINNHFNISEVNRLTGISRNHLTENIKEFEKEFYQRCLNKSKLII